VTLGRAAAIREELIADRCAERVVRDSAFGRALFNDTFSTIWNLNVAAGRAAGDATGRGDRRGGRPRAGRASGTPSHPPDGRRELETASAKLDWEGRPLPLHGLPAVERARSDTAPSRRSTRAASHAARGDRPRVAPRRTTRPFAQLIAADLLMWRRGERSHLRGRRGRRGRELRELYSDGRTRRSRRSPRLPPTAGADHAKACRHAGGRGGSRRRPRVRLPRRRRRRLAEGALQAPRLRRGRLPLRLSCAASGACRAPFRSTASRASTGSKGRRAFDPREHASIVKSSGSSFSFTSSQRSGSRPVAPLARSHE
jgi:hypothetical protein